MANNQADLPKRNAVPAEAPKSLAATVQQVLTKAVTHPSDPKSDFAQGVKHITGDPHQKSAGQADAAGKSLKAENTTTDTNAKDEKGAESLKASADKVKDKEHPIVKEAEEKKDEKEKEVKETEDKKENDKEKETVKEGELPAALQKAIDKKTEAAKESDEKED